MDIVTAGLVCLRRWYIFLPVVLLGVLLAFRSYENVAVSYEAKGSVIVLPASVQKPSQGSLGGELWINPYSEGGGTRLLSVVLGNNLVSSDVRAAVAAEVPGASYTTESSRANPIVTIRSVADSAAAAAATVDVVIEQAEPVVRRIQVDAGAPVTKMFNASRAEPTSLISVQAPGRVKGAVASVLAAIGLGGILALMTDALLVRRAASVAARRPMRKGATDRGRRDRARTQRKKVAAALR